MSESVSQAMGFEQVTVAGTAIGLTQSEFNPPAIGARDAHTALMTLEGIPGTNDIRWTVDGTTPTSTIGHLMRAGESMKIRGLGNLTAFRAIRTSSSAVLTVTYF